jgi:hypothetical protein
VFAVLLQGRREGFWLGEPANEKAGGWLPAFMTAA